MHSKNSTIPTDIVLAGAAVLIMLTAWVMDHEQPTKPHKVEIDVSGCAITKREPIGKTYDCGGNVVFLPSKITLGEFNDKFIHE